MLSPMHGNGNIELVRVLVHCSLGPVHHYLLPLHRSLLGYFNDVLYPKSGKPKPPYSAVGYSAVELVVIGFFTISHCCIHALRQLQ